VESIARIDIVEGIWPALFAWCCLIDHLVTIIYEALDTFRSSLYHLHNAQGMDPAGKLYKKPLDLFFLNGTMPRTPPLTSLVSQRDESMSFLHVESDERW
jgi:hypothetical protein